VAARAAGDSAIDLDEQFSVDGRFGSRPTAGGFAVSFRRDVGNHFCVSRYSVGLD